MNTSQLRKSNSFMDVKRKKFQMSISGTCVPLYII